MSKSFILISATNEISDIDKKFNTILVIVNS